MAFGKVASPRYLPPHLQLKTTVSAPSICYPSTNSVQVSTGFTSNSANEPIDPANLALVGRSVSFIAPGTMGNFSGAQTSIQANGKAVANFNSNGTPGVAEIFSISDNASNTALLTVNTPGSWLGTSSSDWFLPANWCGGAVPTASTNVNIPAGTPRSPFIESVFGGANVNNITIAAGAKLTLGNDAGLDVKGEFTNNGSDIATAPVALTVFSGPGNQTVPGGDYSFLGIAGGGIKTLAADELTSFDRSNCYVAHYKDGSWNSITSGPAFGSNPFFAKRSGITSFSPFAITNPDSPLPVTLARFDAVKEGSTALLSWSTTEETNSDRFEVERSINGKVWQKIATVKAQGESKVWQTIALQISSRYLPGKISTA